MSLFQKPFVIDTNILLDCFVFNDSNVVQLKHLLTGHQLHWIASFSMEEEFLRVLTYPAVSRWLDQKERRPDTELSTIFSQYAQRVNDAPLYERYLCQDQDDQKFINLALAQEAVLLSKDRAVLKMASKLKRQNVIVSSCLTSL